MFIGVIVGTGVDFFSSTEPWSEVQTPYGSAHLSTATVGGREVALLRRHGPGLNVPPHLINYRANMWALREAGVRRVIATAAVGSMWKDISPGTMSVIDDFIDFTKRRETTIFDQPGETVVHTDFTTPYCLEISDAIETAASDSQIALGKRVTYMCVDGPRYETPAEIEMFARWGGDVVGMTGVPEVILARELGMCYGALAIVTNYAAGILKKPLSHEEVVRAVAERRHQIEKILTETVTNLPKERNCTCCS